MSASPIARQVTENKAIPTKRFLITDPSQLPRDYSSTPGGTLYSTTPGGTRIVYERAFLMNLRNSPISKTPPKGEIPVGLLKGTPHCKVTSPIISPLTHEINSVEDAAEQFQMEM